MSDRLRIDKWLWVARFYKSRSLATKRVNEGKIRVNNIKISKPSHTVQIGDVLTFMKAEHVRVIEVVEFGNRRGPAAEAQTLYKDHSEPRPIKEHVVANPKYDRGGRPSKKERRQDVVFRGKHLE